MQWSEKKIRGAGICVPLFSIRTKRGFGIGEFPDLKLLVDWAVQCGISLIQLLPVNDTSVTQSWIDSYPYSSLSAFALHPIYAHLDNLKNEDIPGDLDYEKVYHAKMDAFKKLFAQKGDYYLNSLDFKHFCEKNQFWLDAYALFCTLRDHFKTANYQKWEQFSSINTDQINELTQPSSDFYLSIQFYRMVQFLLAQQFTDAVEYALGKGVYLKGDFAIGVNRYSVDTWIYPELFQWDKSIGAPPDFFNANGQNWDFPSYNWTNMEKNHYEWMCKRLSYISRFFQLIRIDHILGYFRLWEIPSDAINGVRGYFNPCIPIHRSELEQLGIKDIERLTTPFVEDQESLELLRKYKTEKIVYQEVNDEVLRKKLYSILNNVILFCDEKQKDSFHFRFNMQQTSSFSRLDENLKGKLQLLYEDYFFHRQDELWKKEALKKLPYLQRASSMLVCAEDLGFVPKCVKEVLGERAILELYIQRMPKKADQEFGLPWEYSYLSVCAPSNHDTSVVREYLMEDPQRTQRYFEKVLKIEANPNDLTADIYQKILQQHLDAPSMWTIFLLQDLLSMEPFYCKPNPRNERINDPETPQHYWRFRFDFFLEDLIEDNELSQKILEMIKRSSRLCFRVN